MTVGGPLLHIMPIMKPHRPLIGDPYWNEVSFLSEWRGRKIGDTGPATALINIPQDSSPNNLPLEIAGTPHRFPLAADGVSAAPKGVSNNGVYEFDRNDSVGSAIVVTDCGPLALHNHDFTIYIRFRSTDDTGFNFAGRWNRSGGLSWTLHRYIGMNHIRFQVSVDGSTNYVEMCRFRLGNNENPDHDGISAAQLFDNNWHEIIVSRTGPLIQMTIDGHLGYQSINMIADFSNEYIYEPGPSNSLLHIGSLAADPTGIRTGTGNFEGQISHFQMIINGVQALNLNFDKYWGMWWAGNYPQSHINTSNILGSTLFQDEAGLVKHPTYVGNAWPFDPCLDLLNEDFTIEVFEAKFKFINKEIQTIVGQGWPKQRIWRFIVQNSAGPDTPGSLVFQYSLDNSTINTVTLIPNLVDGEILTRTLAVSRYNGYLRFYVDGQLVTTVAITTSLYSAAIDNVPLRFFNNTSKQDSADSSYRVLAIRITKGVGRYRGPYYRIPPLPLPLKLP